MEQNQNAHETQAAERETFGRCPLCHEGQVRRTPKGYGCSRWKEAQCRFVIWNDMSRRTITPDLVRQLLTTGKTTTVVGFRSKAGKPFSAALRLEEGQVRFEFPER